MKEVDEIEYLELKIFKEIATFLIERIIIVSNDQITDINKFRKNYGKYPFTNNLIFFLYKLEI